MKQDPCRVTRQPRGAFCRAELASADAAASKEFLTALLGWDTLDIRFGEADHEVYTMFTLDGENIAALSQLSPAMLAQGIPSAWSSYITVDDIDALIPRIAALGGRATPGPVDIFDAGRMIACMDTQGAPIRFWQARSHIGAGTVNRPGAMAWNELNTPDREAAQAFYGALLGWQFADAGPPGHSLILNQGRAIGGMLQMSDDWQQADGRFPPADWTVYFAVADIDAAVEKVGALGGEALFATMAADDFGRFRIVKEPAGARFMLIQLARPPAGLDQD